MRLSDDWEGARQEGPTSGTVRARSRTKLVPAALEKKIQISARDLTFFLPLSEAILMTLSTFADFNWSPLAEVRRAERKIYLGCK